MNRHDAPPNARSQCGRILHLLESRCGEWVPLPEILALGCAQYNARLHSLRRAGYVIENKTETIGNQRHSWFRLLPPTKPEPVPEADFMRERREEEAQENPLFARGAA
jgi:hypothetical protein